MEHPSLKRVITKIKADDPMFIPQYQTEGAACCDLVANIPLDENGLRQVTLTHRSTERIDCGFSMEIKPGYKACIVARSGLASKGLIVSNSVGTVDYDFRGRVQTLVTNVGKEIIVIKHGDRIAQFYIEPVYQFEWLVAEALSETERGIGGFGSTGVK
jgi:dUTP pyrophosphatase